MIDDSFAYLQDWYARHCDGDWEHDSRIRISSLDNPGWRLWVNIEDTEITGERIELTTHESSDDNWIHYSCDGAIFDAACGPANLGQALDAFRRLAEKRS